MNKQLISKKDIKQLKPVDYIPFEYHYSRRGLIMTAAEIRFYKHLESLIGKNYYIFPQIHLSTLFDHKIYGQRFLPAFRHINGKSVDFVVCSKNDARPQFAIELDDWSHKLEHRKQRDTEVERIFYKAGLPLIRFKSEQGLTVRDIINGIKNTAPRATA
jgi:very-short-patch-repair endonuclease